jgi:hypothetical protein
MLVVRVVAQQLEMFLANVTLEGSSSYSQELSFEHYSEPL